jgi:hypothetical protein
MRIDGVGFEKAPAEFVVWSENPASEKSRADGNRRNVEARSTSKKTIRGPNPNRLSAFRPIDNATIGVFFRVTTQGA